MRSRALSRLEEARVQGVLWEGTSLRLLTADWRPMTFNERRVHVFTCSNAPPSLPPIPHGGAKAYQRITVTVALLGLRVRCGVGCGERR